LQAYDTVVAACKLAVEGVNGPVLVDLPENIQAEMVSLPTRTQLTPTPTHIDYTPTARGVGSTHPTPTAAAAASALRGHHTGCLAPEPFGLRSRAPTAISRGVMGEVLKHIRGARRPLLLVGGGCVSCDEALLNELVEVLAMPVVYTFMGKVSVHALHRQICWHRNERTGL
jgi:thiamine pyrophosphate-dependent acetolactate synthase large subunit-like protein